MAMAESVDPFLDNTVSSGGFQGKDWAAAMSQSFARDLPASTAQPQPRPEKPLFLTVKADLGLAIDNASIERERLASALDAATKNDKTQRIFLRAAQSVSYGDLTEVMNALRAAGARIDAEVPRGTVPSGEARNIHVGGGRYVSLLGGSPYFHNPMDLWPQFRSPLLWDVFAVSTYLTISAVFWFVGLIPDLATLRDSSKPMWKKKIYGMLAMGWRNSARHWRAYETYHLTMAALAVPLVCSVHSIVGLDFAGLGVDDRRRLRARDLPLDR